MLGDPFVLGDDPAAGLFEPGHLWFLVVLLAFSLLFLPIFWYLRQPAGGALSNGLPSALITSGSLPPQGCRSVSLMRPSATT